jgi:hypothetical protein
LRVRGAARYSPAEYRSFSMIGILAMIVFVGVLAALNKFEFGRFD